MFENANGFVKLECFDIVLKLRQPRSSLLAGFGILVGEYDAVSVLISLPRPSFLIIQQLCKGPSKRFLCFLLVYVLPFHFREDLMSMLTTVNSRVVALIENHVQPAPCRQIPEVTSKLAFKIIFWGNMIEYQLNEQQWAYQVFGTR